MSQSNDSEDKYHILFSESVSFRLETSYNLSPSSQISMNTFTLIFQILMKVTSFHECFCSVELL